MFEQKWCHLRYDHPVRALQGHKKPEPFGPVELIVTFLALFVVGMTTTIGEAIWWKIKPFLVKRKKK